MATSSVGSRRRSAFADRSALRRRNPHDNLYYDWRWRMNSSSFLRADGSIAPPRNHWWSGWLPSLSQVQQAIQLNFAGAPTADESTWGNVWAISMRQGLGLVVVAA